MSSTDDQGPDHGPFNDPTAPVPEAPLTPPHDREPPAEVEPPSPYPTQPPASGPGPYGQQPQYGAPPPPGEQPYAQDPYAQPQYGQPQPPAYGQEQYGQPQPPAYGQEQYGQPQPPAYGQEQYGQPQPPAYGQEQYGQAQYGAALPGPYAPAPGAYGVQQSNGSALTLTILSGISLLCCGGIFSIPALVFGIIALTKKDSDPAESRRMTKFGWIAFGIGVAVLVVIAGIVVAIGLAGGFDDGSTYGGY